MSYAHQDISFKDELRSHLKVLVDMGIVEDIWDDNQIQLGEEWDKEIKLKLNSSDIILFLLSSDSLNSEYIQKTEIVAAIERSKLGQAMFIPILVRSIHLDNHPIGRYTLLPRNRKPVSSWNSKDDAYTHIVAELEKELKKKQSQTVSIKKLKKKTKELNKNKESFYVSKIDNPTIQEIEKIIAMEYRNGSRKANNLSNQGKIFTYQYLMDSITEIENGCDQLNLINPGTNHLEEKIFAIFEKFTSVTSEILVYLSAVSGSPLKDAAQQTELRCAEIKKILLNASLDPSSRGFILQSLHSTYFTILQNDLEKLIKEMNSMAEIANKFSLN